MAAFVTSELTGLDPVVSWLNALGQPRRIAEGLANIGGLVENQIKARIADEKRTPDGEAWAPWSDSYAASRHGNQSLLQASGAYLDSFAWDLSGDDLRVGSNMVQAAILNFGGTDDMAPGPAAIPAREHIGVSAENIQEIEEALADWIESIQ
ncbi:phage virion morphogenesis protein [Brevundimonas faecalis]|uniref:phage virion morphogenesis protein n=1 Tax=Brevundimonas faecalis TaxID=947378 RepID=UPI00361EBC55